MIDSNFVSDSTNSFLDTIKTGSSSVSNAITGEPINILSKIIVLVVLTFVLIIGRIKLKKLQNKLIEQKNFSEEYIRKFQKYIESNGRDLNVYTWLITKSVKMQNYMGELGVLSVFSPPLRQVSYRNYQIIVNMIPYIKEEYDSKINQILTTFDTVGQCAGLIQDSLFSYLGTLDEDYDDLQKLIKNPLIWFREGVRTILNYPINILSFFGLVSDLKPIATYSSKIMVILSGIISLIGIISGLITIFNGWEIIFQIF